MRSDKLKTTEDRPHAEVVKFSFYFMDILLVGLLHKVLQNFKVSFQKRKSTKKPDKCGRHLYSASLNQYFAELTFIQLQVQGMSLPSKHI